VNEDLSRPCDACGKPIGGVHRGAEKHGTELNQRLASVSLLSAQKQEPAASLGTSFLPFPRLFSGRLRWQPLCRQLWLCAFPDTFG
jgi:hypothetical protein